MELCVKFAPVRASSFTEVSFVFLEFCHAEPQTPPYLPRPPVYVKVQLLLYLS